MRSTRRKWTDNKNPYNEESGSDYPSGERKRGWTGTIPVTGS